MFQLVLGRRYQWAVLVLLTVAATVLMLAGTGARAVRATRSLSATLSLASTVPPIPVISSVSGCRDAGNATYNCNLTSLLTITGSGFLPSADSALVVSVGSYPDYYYCWLQDGSPPTNSSVVCWLASDLPQYWPGNKLLPVVVGLPYSGISSEPFHGVSMFHIPLPQLDTISGCDDSNNTLLTFTQHCDPSYSVLTVTGSAFSFLAAPSRFTLLLLDGRAAPHNPGAEVLQVVDDAHMLIPLNASYLRLVEPDHYGGAALELSVQYSFWISNSLQLSLIPTPPPVILALAGCTDAFPLLLTGCVPGESSVFITGRWFVGPLSVLVGGLPCRLPTSTEVPFTATSIWCILPSFRPSAGQQYDLLVNTTVYSDSQYVASVGGAIQFASSPTLTGGAPCINNGINAPYSWVNGPANMKCQGGASVYWLGYGFPAHEAVVVLMTVVNLYGEPYAVLECGGAVLLNTSALWCTLPQLGLENGTLYTDAFQWGLRVQLTFSGGVTSNELTIDVYDQPNPPFITSIAGCGVTVDSTELELTQCYPDAVLTVSGLNFERNGNVVVSNDYPFDINMYPVPWTGSVTELVLQLAASSVGWPRNTAYSFTIRNQLGTSNSLLLSVVDPPNQYAPSSSSSSSAAAPAPPSVSSSSTSSSSTGTDTGTSSSSSGGLSVGGVIGVVLGAVILLLCAVMAVLYLRRQRTSKHSTTLVDSSDDTQSAYADSSDMELSATQH